MDPEQLILRSDKVEFKEVHRSQTRSNIVLEPGVVQDREVDEEEEEDEFTDIKAFYDVWVGLSLKFYRCQSIVLSRSSCREQRVPKLNCTFHWKDFKTELNY